jgi:hypothetical protein
MNKALALRYAILAAISPAIPALSCAAAGQEPYRGASGTAQGGTGGVSGGASAGAAGSGGGSGGQCGPPYVCMTQMHCYQPDADEGVGGAGGAGGAGDASGADAGGAAGAASVECPTLPPEDVASAWVVCSGGGPCGFVGEPVVLGGQCCYVAQSCFLFGCLGRPFTIDGTARSAAPVETPGWLVTGALPPPPDSAELAHDWLADALAEHASIAAFAKLSLELLALGAPPELLCEAQRAALDEIEHARLCFGIAAHLSERDLGPGALDVTGATARAPTLARLAAETVREGCIAETIAALIAARQAEVAGVPGVRAALERIADDEGRHAALAYRIVAWALRAGGGEVRRAVERAFDEGLCAAAERRAREPEAAAARHDWGRLGAEERRRAELEAIELIVAPARQALLTGVLAPNTISRTPSIHA